MSTIVLACALWLLGGCERRSAPVQNKAGTNLEKQTAIAPALIPAVHLAPRQTVPTQRLDSVARPPAVRAIAVSPPARAEAVALPSPNFAVFPPSERVSLRASDDDPARGDKDAPVTAIVFGDVQCPFTKQALAALEAVQARVGADRLRIAWKSYPLDFHERARPAAEAIAATELLSGAAAAFTVLHAALGGAVDDAALEEAARGAGVPVDTYRFVLSETREGVEAKIDADVALASSAGVRGVPHVVIGDRTLRGAASEADYAAAFEEVFAAAMRR